MQIVVTPQYLLCMTPQTLVYQYWILEKYQSAHIIYYDLEVEFFGEFNCNKNSPILCGTFLCSCGWSRFVTIILTLFSYCKQIHSEDNRGIAETIFSLFIIHKPTFIIGHHIYAFDNKLFGTSLGPDHSMSSYFKQVVSSDSIWGTEFGIIIDIPGINNLDKFRFIKQSVFSTYKSFSLKYLCEVNNIPYPKVYSTCLVFSNKWHNDSIINFKDMIRYNMADCTANLYFFKALDLINQTVCL